MEEGGVPANAGLIDSRAGIDIRSMVQQQRGGCSIIVFGGDVQQRPSLNRQTASAGLAAMEFRETPIHQCGICVDLLDEPVEPPAEKVHHRRNVVLVSPPASRRMSMQALNCSGERAYDAMT